MFNFLILESSMKNDQIWNDICHPVEALYDCKVYYKKRHGVDVTRKRLYDKAVHDLAPTADLLPSHHVLNFKKVLNRIDFCKEFDSDLSELYFLRYVAFWTELLTSHEIKYIISPVAPHRTFDYALLVASEHLGVHFVSFVTTPFDKRLFIIDDFIRSSKPVLDLPLIDDEEMLMSIVEEDFELRCQPYKVAMPTYERNNLLKNHLSGRIINLLRGLKNEYWTPFRSAKQLVLGGRANRAKVAVYILGRHHRLNKLKHKYNKLVSRKVGQKYIYFPLHMQPEETSQPSAGVYSNQLLIIDTLLKILPDSLQIVVKEHRSQFNPKFNGDLGRMESFYEVYSKDPRVRFASLNEDQFDLVDNAEAVATLSATVGYEAYCRGKHVIIFGRSWLSH